MRAAVAALWELSGYIAGGIVAVTAANKFKEGHREGWNNQRNQDRRAKRDVDSRQANVAKSTNSNYGEPTPDGGNEPRRPKGEKTLAKVATAVGVTTTVGAEVIALSEADLFEQESGNTTPTLSENSDFSEMESVCGNHLSNTDSDYWNSLSDEQRQGYNEERTRQWQEYLTQQDD